MNLGWLTVFGGERIKTDTAYALENLVKTGEFLVREGS
jgi:hypothetical protein